MPLKCTSHDLLEGCGKAWLLVILKHFVDKHWFSWDSLEELIKSFPYKGKDSLSKPAVMKGKKMKTKQSRRIVGTFSEVSTLIRSLSQIIYDQIKDPSDPYWIWMLYIRSYLRYNQMSRISECQVDELDSTLTEMMNMRLSLTKVVVINESNSTDAARVIDEESSNENNKVSDNESAAENIEVSGDEDSREKVKYEPPLTFKALLNYI